MENKMLLFDENIAVPLPQPLRFSVSKRAYEQILESGGESVLEQFSRSQTLLCIAKPEDKPVEKRSYRFFTYSGCFICTYSPGTEKDPAALFAIAFQASPSFKDQNEALTQGHVFLVPKGIIIRIKLTAHERYFCLKDGEAYEEANHFDRMDVSESISKIMSTMSENGAAIPEEVSLNEGLAELLDLAEQYAKLENALEETRVHQAGKLHYEAFEGAENASDRTAATLIVGAFDDKVYKEKTQVVIVDKEQKEHPAEVTEAVPPKGGEPGKLEILFKEQVDFRDFQQQGYVTPSFNSINMDVQLKAIERIRSGNSPAFHYMNKIFDDQGFNDFDNKDLSAVDVALNALKDRPNKSQIGAIKAGINTKNIFLVMGPPGTGKTTVILEWIKYFVKQEHLRVLVSSQNNKAVDNVLDRIKDEPGIDMIRIGTETKVEPSVREFLFDRKLKHLRESIQDSTNENMGKIDRLIGAWEGICNAAKALSERILAFRIAECASRIDDVCAKLRELEQKSSGLWKIVYWLPMFFKRRALSKLYDELAGIRDADSAKENIAEYAQFIIEKEGLSGDGSRLQEMRNDISKAETALEQVTKQPPETTLGLFEEIKRKLEANVSGQTTKPYRKSEEFCKELQDELNRSRKILELMREWQREVLGRQNYSLLNIILESVDVVGATCIGVNSQKRFDGLKFDITIIDEAGQIQLHKALVPMSVSGKLIMLGDHKQIPPNADSDMVDSCKADEISADYLSKSLFESMYDSFPDSNKAMLDTQYRMPGEIADTLSREFYDGKYLSWSGKRGLKSVLSFLAEQPYIIVDTSGAGERRFEQKVENAGCRNDLEAEIIETIVKRMYMDKQDMDKIGIISAYKKQVDAIVKRLRPILGGPQASKIAATLDSFQGQERDVILYSFTRSSTKPSNKVRIGFLNELRRLNVAMSRPKKTLVLIGDMAFLSSCQNLPAAEDEEDTEQKRYQRSEKHFGDFIRQVIADVKKHGAYLSYEEFVRRMEG